jgi:hypothetical protein
MMRATWGKTAGNAAGKAVLHGWAGSPQLSGSSIWTHRAHTYEYGGRKECAWREGPAAEARDTGPS